MAAPLINLLGFAMGAVLYAMLLWMVARSPRPAARSFGSSSDRLSLVTGALGVTWNVGAFWGYGLFTLGVVGFSPLLLACAFSALAFLPAVVVHSVLRSIERIDRRRERILLAAAYGLSGVAAALHLVEASFRGVTPSSTALEVLTAGFVAVIAVLLVVTRGTAGYGRVVWVAALALFAVSALHLTNHTGADPWWVELAGHHASLPLALAFLHQDYRFALADIFLKRALALLALVVLVFGTYEVAAARIVAQWGGDSRMAPRSIIELLGLWVATALAYPWIRAAAAWIVDRVILARPDYDLLLAQVAQTAARHEAEEPLLDDVTRMIGPAFSARSVTWRTAEGAEQAEAPAIDLLNGARSARVVIPSVDAPRYVLTLTGLEGGRRLLSGDAAAIERLTFIVARRVDALRKAREQFQQELREREVSRLAAEAELRALRAQIEPHFLFNALTTIGYLIKAAPEQAITTLFRLSELLRKLLRSNPEFWTLGEEIRFIEAYLDIERARFEDRLSVSIEVPESLHAFHIPTLLLQPLVENAIKHGIGKSSAGGSIRLSANLLETGDHPPLLRIVIEDTGAGADEAQFRVGRLSGVGLNHVERRLQCYENRLGTMRIAASPGLGAFVEVEFPAETSRETASGVLPHDSVSTRSTR